MVDKKLETVFDETISMFWVTRESGNEGYTYIGDGGNIYGRYGFTLQYSLSPFMNYCLHADNKKYKEFAKYTILPLEELIDAIGEIRNLWVKFCDTYKEEFYRLQDEYSYEKQYLPAKENCIKRGIDIDSYSPVLKGSLWSFSVRSGVNVGSKKIINAYKKGATDELTLLKKSYSTYNNCDSGRWSVSSENSQYADAIKVYNLFEEQKEFMRKILNDEYIESEDSNDIAKEEEIVPVKEECEIYDVVEKVSEENIDPFSENEEDEQEELNQDTIHEEEDKYDSIDRCQEELYFVFREYKPTDIIPRCSTNRVGVYEDYKEAKDKCIESAKKTGRIHYVYSRQGICLFISNPNTEKKDVVNGYMVGTGYFNGSVINKKGTFNSYLNAVKYADFISKKDQISYKVYLDGILQYTATTR